MPLASIDPPCWQYVFILAWKPDGGLTMALFGGHIDMNDFAIALEHALHQTYYLGSASKSFHMYFDSYDSVLKTLGIKCVGSCFNCGRLGEIFQKCEGCPFARYLGETANASTGKQDIGRRVPPSASIIAADVAQNILLCGGSFLGMVSIYGNIWLSIVLVNCLESPM